MAPSLTSPSQTPYEEIIDHNLPRLLCLHGGGTNARIFRLQCRSLIKAFAPHFHLVFPEGPYLCPTPGSDVLRVYENHGPFKRWGRWLPEHPPTTDEEALVAIEGSLRAAMEADNAAGWTGEWVGLLGFSQGAKMAASILYEIQLQREEAVAARIAGRPSTAGMQGFAGANWRFAILLAGRAPLVALSDRGYRVANLEKPSDMTVATEPGQYTWNESRISLPTVHVHGLKDPGLKFHRVLLDDFTEPGTAELLEWEGGHRVAIKTADVEPLVDATLQAFKMSPRLPTVRSI